MELTMLEVRRKIGDDNKWLLNTLDEGDIDQSLFLKIRNDRFLRGQNRKPSKNQVAKDVKKYFHSNRVLNK